MTSLPTRKQSRIRGTLSVERVRVGTASEHSGLVLTTRSGKRYVCGPLGGDPFAAPTTPPPTGTVYVEGYVVGSEMRYTAILNAQSDRVVTRAKNAMMEAKALRAQVAKLKRDLRESEKVRDVMRDILTRSVGAILGDGVDSLTIPSWHDLPEMIEAIKSKAGGK